MEMQCEQRGEREAKFLLRKLNFENVKNYLTNEYLGTRIEIAYKIYIYTHIHTNKRHKPTECGAVLIFFLCLLLDFAIKIQIKMNCDCEHRTYYINLPCNAYVHWIVFIIRLIFFVSFASIFYRRTFFSLFLHKGTSSHLPDWCFASWQ